MRGLGNTKPTTIEKGTIVYSTAPGWPSGGKPLGHKLRVLAIHERGQLTWVGSGGYWRWVKTNAS